MRRLLPIAFPLAIVLALVLWRAGGATPRSTTAPATAFSSARAASYLRNILADRTPHPIGSAANVRVRERIETQFRALGYDTFVQRRFVCNASANCGAVENLIARRRGDVRRGDVVLLVAHYDSVPAAPGASDDGVGVATMLEVARAIRNEHFLNRVEFLIDDGEEAGLLGAEAFVADRSLSRDVAAVINVEMRGTYGASYMFETSRGNRWLIRHLAHSLRQPQSSSLFATVYDLLPNDTDVTIFKREGIAAVNFAAVRGVTWYHTPLDDLAHVTPATLQHHGDNVLSTLRKLGDADLAARSRSDAVWFDVLGFFLAWWPQEWTIWIGVVSLLVLLFAARQMPPRTMTLGVLGTFLAIIIAAVAGVALAWIARLHSDGVNFSATPWPSVTAMWLAGIAAAVLAMSFFRKSKDAEALLYGVAFVWHALAITLALTLPGTSYLFLVPSIALTVCAVARAGEAATAIVSSTTAAVVLFPIVVMLYDALGSALMFAMAILIAMFSTLFAPLVARRENAVILMLLAVASAVLAAYTPVATRERPRRISLAYVDDPVAGTPLWQTERITPALRRAAPFQENESSLTPWSASRMWSAPAPRYPLPRVTIDGSRTADRAVVRVRTSRHGARLVLAVRGAKVLRVNGAPLAPRPMRFHRRGNAAWETAVASGVDEMIVELQGRGKIEAVAADVTSGLPSAGAKLVAARNASHAVQEQGGDVTITRAHAVW